MKVVSVITIVCLLCISCCDGGLYWRKIFTDPGCTDESEVAHFYFPTGGGYSCTLDPGCVEIAAGQFWAIEDCSTQPVFRDDFIRVTLDTSTPSCSNIRSLYTDNSSYRLTGCDENGVITIAAWNSPDCSSFRVFNFTTSATKCNLVDFGYMTGTCVVPPLAPIAPPIDPPIMDTPINVPINIPVNAPKATPVAKMSASVSNLISSMTLIFSIMLINII